MLNFSIPQKKILIFIKYFLEKNLHKVTISPEKKRQKNIHPPPFSNHPIPHHVAFNMKTNFISKWRLASTCCTLITDLQISHSSVVIKAHLHCWLHVQRRERRWQYGNHAKGRPTHFSLPSNTKTLKMHGTTWGKKKTLNQRTGGLELRFSSIP